MSLCLSCGLCCDGTIFDAAPVTPEEAARLEGRVRLSADRTRLLQGCQALEGCRCEVYEARPAACRAFKCLVLASLELGQLTEAEAREGLDEVMARREVVAKLMGIEEPRRALQLARARAAAGTASEELKHALQRLKQVTLLLTLQPGSRQGQG